MSDLRKEDLASVFKHTLESRYALVQEEGGREQERVNKFHLNYQSTLDILYDYFTPSSRHFFLFHATHQGLLSRFSPTCVAFVLALNCAKRIVLITVLNYPVI